MVPRRTLGLAVAAFLVGLTVGAVAVSGLVPVDSGGVDADRPPYSISTGTGCITQSDDWAYTAPVDTSASAARTFLLRASIAHGADRDLDVRLEHAGEGRYLFVVTPTDAETKPGTPACADRVYGSTVDLAATLPADFESVTVVYDGEPITVVENPDDRAPTYHQLSF